MPRPYVVTFEGVAVSVAQDLFTILGATGKMLEIIRVKVGATDTTIPTAQMIETRGRYLPVTLTVGSGGATPTPQKLDPGDATASFTAHTNDTTKTTTNGTAAIVYESGDHLFNGVDETFDGQVLPQVQVGPSEAFVFELLSTVTGTVHLSGTCWVRERGG